MFGGIAAAGNDRIVFALAGGEVVFLDLKSGAVAGQFGRNPSGPAEVRVSACAVAADGSILLGDSLHSCVRRFRPDGLQVRRYGRLATPGIETPDEAGVLSDPCAILPLDGGLLVGCGGFEVEHGVQRVAGRGGPFRNPAGVWRRVHGLGRVAGEIWVTETEGGAIHRFGADGRHLERIAFADEFQRPFRIAYDGFGEVLALFAPETEQEQSLLGIARLTRDGAFLDWAVPAGEEPGQVFCPFDLAVLPDGRFVAADLPLGNPPDVRLQLFSADGRLLATLLGDRIDLDAALTAWFDAQRTQGSAYERARVHHDYSGGGEAHRRRAAELYRLALDEEPRLLLARLQLARLLEPEQPEQAEREYAQAIACGADAGDVGALIARCRAAQNDWDGAIEALEEVVGGAHPPEELHRWVELLGTYYLRRAGEESY